ncbi:MAG TPA: hypothetical protein VHI13_11420 [Candidatus Kapabacteria bacterium]|nr:hypothetical protein [Candidatus Kapabacteria bacterium]
MEYLIHNPQIAVYIVLMLFFLVSRGLKQKQAAERKNAAAARENRSVPSGRYVNSRDRQAEARARREQEMRERLEMARRRLSESSSPIATSAESALLRVMEQADRQFFSPDRSAVTETLASGTAAVSPPEPVPAAGNGGSGDPFAFQSLLHRDDGKARVDYDVASTDYDKRAQAFEFRPPVRESEGQEFHLQSFAGFQAARGMSRRDLAQIEAEAPYGTEEESASLQSMFNSPEALRRAVIAHEILSRRGGHRR